MGGLFHIWKTGAEKLMTRNLSLRQDGKMTMPGVSIYETKPPGTRDPTTRDHRSDLSSS